MAPPQPTTQAPILPSIGIVPPSETLPQEAHIMDQTGYFRVTFHLFLDFISNQVYGIPFLEWVETTEMSDKELVFIAMKFIILPFLFIVCCLVLVAKFLIPRIKKRLLNRRIRRAASKAAKEAAHRGLKRANLASSGGYNNSQSYSQWGSSNFAPESGNRPPPWMMISGARGLNGLDLAVNQGYSAGLETSDEALKRRSLPGPLGSEKVILEEMV